MSRSLLPWVVLALACTETVPATGVLVPDVPLPGDPGTSPESGWFPEWGPDPGEPDEPEPPDVFADPYFPPEVVTDVPAPDPSDPAGDLGGPGDVVGDEADGTSPDATDSQPPGDGEPGDDRPEDDAATAETASGDAEPEAADVAVEAWSPPSWWCRPCTTDADCASPGDESPRRCVEAGPSGSFCAVECGGGCPAGTACVAKGGASGCLPAGGAECPCTEEFAAAGYRTGCRTVSAWGSCQGSRTCDRPCDGPVPVAEACNGADDDCDGKTDEGYALDCFEGPNDNCQGIPNPDQADLDQDGQGDACDPDDDADGVPDVSDVCPMTADPDQADLDSDGVGDACEWDRDGDGVADDDDDCPDVWDPLQQDLNGNLVGDACEPDWDGDGVANADDDCPWLADPAQADADLDGAGDACDCDADGDGVANENPGCPDPDPADDCPLVPNPVQSDLDGDGVGDACDPDIDGDGHDNDEDCAPDDPAIHPGRPEACNAADDDCDGLTDEEFAAKGFACDGIDADLCAYGTWTCRQDGTALECVNETPMGVADTCNGADDDCDGATDEDFPAKGQACDGPDADACAYGTWTCRADGAAVECVNEWPANVAEVCNGADDDCDGKADEDFPLKGVPCDGPDSDFCARGTWTCRADGAAVECVNEWPANVAEVCNGADDDCDGGVDEDFPAKGQACDSADSDSCAYGSWTCRADGAGVECVNEWPANVAEVCNGTDDDCDGQLDENVCPCQWKNNGHGYLFCTHAKTWDQARWTCQTHGLHMVAITSQAENTWVNDTAAAIAAGATWWTGGTDAGHEGWWTWEDGEGWPYSNWQAGEPNNANGVENCLELRRFGNRKWNDIPCWAGNYYVCEQ